MFLEEATMLKIYGIFKNAASKVADSDGLGLSFGNLGNRCSAILPWKNILSYYIGSHPPFGQFYRFISYNSIWGTYKSKRGEDRDPIPTF